MNVARRAVASPWRPPACPYTFHHRPWRDSLSCHNLITCRYKHRSLSQRRSQASWHARWGITPRKRTAEEKVIPLREDSSKPSLVRRFLNYFTSKAPEDEALPTAEQVHQNAAKATPAKPKSLPSTTTSSTDTKINNGSDKRPPLEAKPQTIYPIKGPHQGITQSDLPSRVQLAISEAIPAVEAILHYKFSDPLLLWEALQEEKNGLFTTERRHFPEGNLMLALVGDKLLSSACSLIWYGSGSPRGAFDNTFQSPYVRNTALAAQGKKAGIDRWINYRAGAVDIATAVEAVIGAVHLDGGFEAALRVMRRLELLPRGAVDGVDGKRVRDAGDWSSDIEETSVLDEEKLQGQEDFRGRIHDKIELYVQAEIERRVDVFFGGLKRVDTAQTSTPSPSNTVRL